MHPDDVAPKMDLWTRARETGAPFEAEYRLRGVNGTYRWQLTRALPKRDASGAITKWYGSVLDVDDRRRAEEALRDADHRKDEFLAMLAHELRNPLAPICHALAVQARSSDTDVWNEMRQTMERQVEHLVRLVDDLLDVSRLTMGRITLRREPVDIRDTVTDALDTCRRMLVAKSHRVTTHMPPGPLIVEGDRVRLVQIVTNILNNAGKFTDPGGDIDVAVSGSGESIEGHRPRQRRRHLRGPAGYDLRALLSERPLAQPGQRRPRGRPHVSAASRRHALRNPGGRQ